MCTHCGFKQLESPYAKSTFCRKCSEHYDIGVKPAPRRELPRISLFEKIGDLLGRKKFREINCFKCGTRQTISISAKSSLCPHCSTYQDLTDFKITTPYNRSIETQGIVEIGKGGDVTSSRISCGEAIIRGRLRGNLICSGAARLEIQGKFHGTLDVRNFIVEKRADFEAVRPIRCKTAEISGRMNGKIIAEGTVRITAKGWLEGEVEAAGIDIERGGVFLGQLSITRQRQGEEGEGEEIDENEIIAAPIMVEPVIGEVVVDPTLEPDEPAGPVVPPSHRSRKRGGRKDDDQLHFGIG
mgnify:FL=1